MLPASKPYDGLMPGVGGFLVIAGLVIVPTASLVAMWKGAAGSEILDIYTLSLARFTLFQALLSTLLSIGLAVPVALALARRTHFAGRIWIIRLMAVPMGLPVLIGALGLIAIFGRQGMFNQALHFLGRDQPISIYGLSGILIAHVFFNLPLACRLMLAALERLPTEYWRLAASLGMRSTCVFRFIELPALIRVIPGAAGLIFMLCATSFTLVLLLGGGPQATTLEVAIYQSLRFDFDPIRAVTLSTLQILVTGFILAGLSLVPISDSMSIGEGRRLRRFDGKGLGPQLWDGLFITLATLFLVLPLGAIVWAGVRSDLWRLVRTAAFQQATLTSLALGFASATLTVALAASIVWTRQAIEERKHTPQVLRLFSASLGALSAVVLLVPPVVLGTGWFLLLRQVGDVRLFAPAIVIAINMLMALPFAMRIVSPAFATHRIATARLTGSLGIRGVTRWRLIDWPALRWPLAMALSYSMALSLGDLGAVALFGSQDLITLPWLIYSRLGNYRSNDADGLALILALLCLALTFIGTAKGERRN